MRCIHHTQIQCVVIRLGQRLFSTPLGRVHLRTEGHAQSPPSGSECRLINAESSQAQNSRPQGDLTRGHCYGTLCRDLIQIIQWDDRFSAINVSS